MPRRIARFERLQEGAAQYQGERSPKNGESGE